MRGNGIVALHTMPRTCRLCGATSHNVRPGTYPDCNVPIGRRSGDAAKRNNRVRGADLDRSVAALRRQFQLTKKYRAARKKYEDATQRQRDAIQELLLLEHLAPPVRKALQEEWMRIGVLGNFALAEGAPWGAELGYLADRRATDADDIRVFIDAPDVAGYFDSGNKWTAAPVPDKVLARALLLSERTIGMRRKRRSGH